jgi:hypothetical protein
LAVAARPANGGVVAERDPIERHVRAVADEQAAAEARAAAAALIAVAAVRSGVFDGEVVGLDRAADDLQPCRRAARVQRVAIAVDGERDAGLQRNGVEE